MKNNFKKFKTQHTLKKPMKLNLTGWYNGLIGLEKNVIDLKQWETRPRVTEEDLQRYHDECLGKLAGHQEYFEDEQAFTEVLEEIRYKKRPELVARESVYPGFFNHTHSFNALQSIFEKGYYTEDDKYFYVPRCSLPIRLSQDSPYRKLIEDSDERIHKEPCEMQPKIEIPNDSNQAQAKASLFHEALHHVITNYQIKSGRLVTEEGDYSSKKERYVAERFIHEHVIEELTDVLLEDDKEALFARRWIEYEVIHAHEKAFSTMSTAIPCGILLGLGLSYPWLLPFAAIPPILKNILYNRYKDSKKEELTQIRERKAFKL